MDGTPAFGAAVVDDVAKRAGRLARARRDTIGTADLLFAVLDVYGRLFDRAPSLYLREDPAVEGARPGASARSSRTTIA